MSSNNQIQLSPAGQVVLTAAASFACNLIHPMSTIQTCLQARSPIPSMAGLYRGVGASYALDTAAFGTAYVSNDALQRRFSPIGAILAANTLSTLFVTVGEGAMQNRQASNLTYRDKELWQRSIRPWGMAVTWTRELFWNGGIFFVTPKIAGRLERRWPNAPSWLAEAIAAGGTGIAVGFFTTPIAGIKTMVQTSKESLSLFQAVRKIIHPPKPLPDGSFVRLIARLQEIYNRTLLQGATLNIARYTERLFAGAVPRIAYLGTTMAITKLVYRFLPALMPDRSRR